MTLLQDLDVWIFWQTAIQHGERFAHFLLHTAKEVHLLKICLVYNTLMIQRVLTEPDWTQRMLRDDLRALTPLIYAHVTPYGTFRLDMSQRLAIEEDAVAA